MEVETLPENQLALIIKKTGLDENKGLVLQERFSEFFDLASEWKAKADSLVITDVSQKEEMKQADEARKFLKNKRTGLEKVRVSLKEDSLKEGRAIDEIARTLTDLIEPLEEDFKQKATFQIRYEAAIKEKLKLERFELLREYTADPNIYPLGELSEEAFTQLFDGLKLASEAAIERERVAEEERAQARVKAEEDRIAREKADAEAREQQRLERIALKEAAENRAREYEAEKARSEAYQKAIEDKSRIEREKAEEERKAIEAKAQAEREKAAEEARKVQAENEAKLKAERDARAKLEADLKAKADAELKAEQDRQAAIEAELSMGDKEKFDALIKDLEAIQTKYSFKSKKYKDIQGIVNELLNKTINHVISK